MKQINFFSSFGRAGLIALAALAFLLAPDVQVGTFSTASLIGVDQAAAQRSNRRGGSQAEGENIVSESVAEAYNAALELLQAGDASGAINAIRPLLEGASPFESSVIYRLMGQAAVEQEDFDRAGQYFQQAIDSGGLQGADLAQLYLIVGQLYAADGNYDRAIRALTTYFQVMREYELEATAQSHYVFAQIYAVAERIREAIPEARTAVDMTRDDPQESYIRLLMNLYMSQEQFSEAIPLLHQLVAIDTTEDDYWQSLAGAYQQLGREREAFAVFQFRYMMGFLDCGDDFVTLSELYMYHDIPYKAGQILEDGLGSGCIEPTGENWEKLGNAWFAAREWNRSREALTRAANLSPDGQLYYRIAGTYIQDENWPQARRFLERALNRGGLDDAGQAWLLLGHACNETEDMECARRAFEQATNYTRWREDAQTWLRVLDNQAEAERVRLERLGEYQEEAAAIRRQQGEAAVLAETAFGLAQEAYENARLANRVSAEERAGLLETTEATLDEARTADDEARGDFMSPSDVRERVREISSFARSQGLRSYAEELETESEDLLERRETALRESDRLLREAEDLLYQARQL